MTEIKAKAWSDDNRISFSFDATSWFEQANDNNIYDLENSDFGFNRPADSVIKFMAEQFHEDARELISYVRNSGNTSENHPGFECQIDRDSAMAWIKSNRPIVRQSNYSISIN